MADAATVSVLLQADDRLSAALEGAQSKIRDFGQSAGQAGRGLLALSAPLMAIGGLSLKAFTDFESSFAGVRKTVDATEEQFQELATGFRSMAKEIPISVNELNRIGEAAGQLGIKTENILLFSRTMADLGVTTNLSSDQAATALARLTNITGLPQTQVDRLGAAIVALGNNLATTEAEIVDFGLRIAGAGAIAGLSEAQILAIGAAMSSVGVQAEAGGTAVQKVLLSMTEQVATSGELLKTFASTAGMSAEEFSKAFREDAAGAFTAFVEGLGKAGTDAFAILAELGLEDQRLIRSFLSLAGAGDLLRTSIDLSTNAFAENTALTEEARKRYETAASQFAILKNELQEVAITIGTALMPPLLGLAKKIGPIVEGIAKWVEANPTLTVLIVALGAAVGILATGLITLSLMLPAIALLAPIVGGAFSLMLGPVGLIILAIIALIAAGVLLWKNWDTIKEKMGGIWEGIKDIFRKGVNFLIGLAEGWANMYVKAVNAIIAALNKIHFKIPDIPGIPGRGTSFGINIPLVPEIVLPRLARGGIVTQPTLAVLGERGPEAIIPLGRHGGAAGITVNINMQGATIYGVEDLDRFVRQSVRDGIREGGFHGLIPSVA